MHRALLFLIVGGSRAARFSWDSRRYVKDAIADGSPNRIIDHDNEFRVLHVACESGLTKEVRQLLRMGADQCVKIKGAVARGQRQLFSELDFHTGADPMHRTTTFGVTALRFSRADLPQTGRGDAAAASPRRRLSGRHFLETARARRHVATWNQQTEVARILLDESTADIDDHQFEGLSPLGFSIIKGDDATANLLLSRGSSRCGSRIGSSPRRRGCRATCETWLRAGAKFYGIGDLDNEGEAMVERLREQFQHTGGRREIKKVKLPSGMVFEREMWSPEVGVRAAVKRIIASRSQAFWGNVISLLLAVIVCWVVSCLLKPRPRKRRLTQLQAIAAAKQNEERARAARAENDGSAAEGAGDDDAAAAPAEAPLPWWQRAAKVLEANFAAFFVGSVAIGVLVAVVVIVFDLV